MPVRLISRMFPAAAFLLLGAASRLAAAAPSPPTGTAEPPGTSLPFRSAIFESSLRFSGSPAGSTVKVWYSPTASLEEIATTEGVSYVLRGSLYSYGWLKGGKTGFKTALGGSAREAGFPDAIDVIRETGFDLLPTNSKFVGVEESGGLRLRHYDFRWRDHMRKGVREGSIWVLEDRPFPVRFVNTGVGGKFEVVNSNFRFDVEIPRELLEPPKNVRFTEFEGGMSIRGGGRGGAASLPGPIPKGPGVALADEAFRVEWRSADVPPRLKPSETANVSVTFRNVSSIAWPDPSTTDPAHSSGSYAVRLCSRWTKEGETPQAKDYKTRTDLSEPLRPGQQATLTVAVTAPSLPGRYELQFDLVQELVGYFESKGAPRLARTVEVR